MASGIRDLAVEARIVGRMTRSTLAFAGLAFAAFLGAIVGVAAHRFHPYWGSALVIALVLSSATFARAFRSWLGLGVYATVWFVTVFPLAMFTGPGGSIVVLDDVLGRTLLIGGSLAVVAPAFFPRKWMRAAEQ
jgi:hypothetical protein